MLQYVDSNDHDCGFFRALNGYTSFIARNSNISLQVEALGGGNLYGVHSYDPASLTSVDMQKSTLQIQTIPIAAITVSLFDDIYEFDAFQSAGAILVADSGDSDIYIFKTTSTSSLVRGIKSSGCDYEISTTIPNNNCYYVRYDLAGVDVVFNSDFVRNTDAVNFVYSNLPWKGSYYSTDDQEMVYSGNFPITLTSASNPSITDDDYRVGSIWVNTSTNKFFVCTDNSTGAAVWQAASDFNHTNEFHIITAGEASAKSFTIAHTPLNPANVTVMIVGGGSVMQYGIDYTIAAASFSWGTYGLDGLLAEGDIVFLSYFY
jgi:hypothetical protein